MTSSHREKTAARNNKTFSFSCQRNVSLWKIYFVCYCFSFAFFSTTTVAPTKTTTSTTLLAEAASDHVKTSSFLRKKEEITSISTISTTDEKVKGAIETPPISISSIPLHAHSGTHHARIYIGSPPQSQIVIVDTGSRFMAFPCETYCNDCGKHVSKSYYNPDNSTTKIWNPCIDEEGGKGCRFEDHTRFKITPTCEKNKCRAQQTYTEGSSWVAYELEDIVWFGTDDMIESLEIHMSLAVPYVFGCQIKETGLFKTQYADGIMGLAMFPTTLIYASHTAGSIPRYAFSMCLTVTGGSLNLGGTALSPHPPEPQSKNKNKNNGYYNNYASNGQEVGHHLEPMRYTPLLDDKGLYTVKITAVYVGDIHITKDEKILSHFQNKKKAAIIDSGTTDVYLPIQIKEAFGNAWTQISKMEYANSYKTYTWKEYQQMPDITFILDGGVHWKIAPKYYMDGVVSKKTGEEWIAKDDNESMMLFNRIYLDEPEGVVLGSLAMMNHDILFDVEGKRVGFARSNCQ